MVVCICGTCTSIWKGKTSDSLLTTPGNTLSDENTTGHKGSKYNCTKILGKNWGLFSVHVVQQTRLDLNIDSECRFHNGFNSHYIYRLYTCIMYDVNQLLFMMTLFRDLVERY